MPSVFIHINDKIALNLIKAFITIAYFLIVRKNLSRNIQ